MKQSYAPKPLRIVTVADPTFVVLRKPAPRVSRFNTMPLSRLVARMSLALREARGVGIAAPQIGEAVAACIVLPLADDYQQDPTALDRATGMLLLNPRIIKQSKTVSYETEACLSVPDYAVQRVPRADAIIVEYQDICGVVKRVAAKGYAARIMQHEIDHLHGTLIIDYMQAQEDLQLATKTGE